MRPRLTALHALLLLLPALFACGSDETKPSTSTSTPPPDLGTVDEIMSSLPQSCAFDCGGCNEPGEPFTCTTLKPWNELPHAKECGDWDGKHPEPVKGQCKATEPTGAAAQKAGPIPGGLVLPDGHRITPAGRDVLFDEADLSGGFPMSILPLTGTRFALVSDGGIKDNAIRLIDLDAIATTGPAVSAYIPFPRPTSLFYGLAFLPPNQALASGGGDGVIYAFDIDTAQGGLARAPNRDIVVAADYYAGPIATDASMTRLLVAPSDGPPEITVFSLAAADYGKKLGAISIKGTNSVFDIRLDPFDPAGKTFYASDQTQARLLEIDSDTLTITRTIPLEKNPEQLAFLDATYLAVAEADSDNIAIIDRAAGTVAAQIPVFEKDAPHGFSPSSLVYDAPSKRLYATLAGVNAVEVYDVAPGSPPSITPAGRVPTAWWPTGVMVDIDGSLVVVNGKGHGTGTDGKKYTWTQGPITDRMRGSIQHVSAQTMSDLSPLSAAVEKNHRLDQIDGRPVIDCPAGAADFPIPADNTSGPSKQIKHVILLVREDKTYDAVFGDRTDLGDGDPQLIMASSVELQSKIWQNARAIAESFTNFDNFYTDAEQSLQGHTWTVYGRTTDFMERAWLTIWGRATRSIGTPATPLAEPEEGGVFSWFERVGVPYDNMGEIIDNAPLDQRYPGLIYAQNRPDIDKSCYIGGRIRLTCDLKPFTYALQTNDHTYGGQAGAAAPEVMIAVNDEASGMLLDALSHSPIWKDSLLIITEDDPQDGGDHIDHHRTPLLMASPWIKRRYASHGHYDMASVYKLLAHIYGVPYNNEMIRNAMLPLDAFTSTPDYTPFTYIPRVVDAPCNDAGTKEAKRAEGWDFDDIDDQPGLSGQIMEMMRESAKERSVRIVEVQGAQR